MFENFCKNLNHYAILAENTQKDGSVNWNFVDADMYNKWSVVLDGETYMTWFDKAADIFEDCA